MGPAVGSIDRGQSELIGTVLLLGIVLVGVTAIVMFGANALDTAQRDSRISSIEHSMTQFDSRAAMVALGSSDTQNLQLGATGDGSYDVDPDSGWVNITHINHSDSGDVETLTNTTLGSVVYRNGDTTIAYQGGGVWRGTGNASIMVSPPEFHYRGSTLTFPIVSVDGTGGASGRPSAGVSIVQRSRRIFPNASEPSYGSTSYRNPIDNGNVSVTVHSDHYVAWRDYFEERTEGDVTIDHGNETATVILTGLGVVGDFQMPNEGNAVPVQGMKDRHNVSDFSVTIAVDKWNKLQWGFYATSGGQEFEIHLAHQGGGNCGSVDEIEVGIYYYNGTTDEYQGWQNESVDLSSDTHFSKDCSADTLTANFTGDTPLGYDAIDTNGRNKWEFGERIDNDLSIAPKAVFDQHAVDTSGGRDGTYDDTSPEEMESIGFVLNHYFGLLAPEFDLRVTDGPASSNSVDEGDSEGTLDYEATDAGFITFLHVTENDIEVDLGS